MFTNYSFRTRLPCCIATKQYQFHSSEVWQERCTPVVCSPLVPVVRALGLILLPFLPWPEPSSWVRYPTMVLLLPGPIFCGLLGFMWMRTSSCGWKYLDPGSTANSCSGSEVSGVELSSGVSVPSGLRPYGEEEWLRVSLPLPSSELELSLLSLSSSCSSFLSSLNASSSMTYSSVGSCPLQMPFAGLIRRAGASSIVLLFSEETERLRELGESVCRPVSGVLAYPLSGEQATSTKSSLFNLSNCSRVELETVSRLSNVSKELEIDWDCPSPSLPNELFTSSDLSPILAWGESDKTCPPIVKSLEAPWEGSGTPGTGELDLKVGRLPRRGLSERMMPFCSKTLSAAVRSRDPGDDLFNRPFLFLPKLLSSFWTLFRRSLLLSLCFVGRTGNALCSRVSWTEGSLPPPLTRNCGPKIGMLLVDVDAAINRLLQDPKSVLSRKL